MANCPECEVPENVKMQTVINKLDADNRALKLRIADLERQLANEKALFTQKVDLETARQLCGDYLKRAMEQLRFKVEIK